MSLIDLQMAVQTAKENHHAKEVEIRSYREEKQAQTARLKTLRSQLSSKQTELRSALTQSAAESLTTEVNKLKEQYQACETLISNIEGYLKIKANDELIKASKEVDAATNALFHFVYRDIKSNLDVMSDAQKDLMKDFVVISQMLSSSLPNKKHFSYYLGHVFDDLYGDIRGDDFTNHKAQMLEKYLTPSN